MLLARVIWRVADGVPRSVPAKDRTGTAFAVPVEPYLAGAQFAFRPQYAGLVLAFDA